MARMILILSRHWHYNDLEILLIEFLRNEDTDTPAQTAFFLYIQHILQITFKHFKNTIIAKKSCNLVCAKQIKCCPVVCFRGVFCQLNSLICLHVYSFPQMGGLFCLSVVRAAKLYVYILFMAYSLQLSTAISCMFHKRCPNAML